MKKIGNIFIFVLYLLLRIVAFPFLVLYFLYRGLRDVRYIRGFAERFGARPRSFAPTPPGGIWLHAVSVGEVLSSVKLIEMLRARNPAVPLFVSVTTLAGRKIAEEKLSQLVSGVFYAPIDYPFAIRRVLARIKPAVLVILETEIWPALYREVKRHRCGLVIVNGRISTRAFSRYRYGRVIFAPTLCMSDAVLVQSEIDRKRYEALGARSDSVRVIGNLKYDSATVADSPPERVSDVIRTLQPTEIVIAASTTAPVTRGDVDEDDAVIAAFQELTQTHEKLLLVIAPRKPERFDEVAGKLRAAGIPFTRRSQEEPDKLEALPGVLLLDTLGELASLFPLATAVFMGGTLARRGGHNILEPAAAARAIVIGPHMENFAAIAEEFQANKAVLTIAKASDLGAALDRILSDVTVRGELGNRASTLARERRGAAEQAVAVIYQEHDKALPDWDRAGPTTPILWVVSKLWTAGLRRGQKRGWAKAQELPAPVISVGGISMGGSGKTPLVEMLACALNKEGLHPAILTRGYNKRSVEDAILAPAGSVVPTWKTGDEPQIFIRGAQADVGIGSDRYKVGMMLSDLYKPGVFLLDDGFQHWRLKRQLDIVLIDGLNPFAGNEVFPLGQLREPVESLCRAGAIVITRAQPGRNYEGVVTRIREANATAPIFMSEVEPLCWTNERTRETVTAPKGPVLAFCGLGNPATFWLSLQELQIEPAFCWPFDDHHHYTKPELRILAKQARALGVQSFVTTEKDAMNLPRDGLRLLEPCDVYWLKIRTRMREEEAFLELVKGVAAGDGRVLS